MNTKQKVIDRTEKIMKSFSPVGEVNEITLNNKNLRIFISNCLYAGISIKEQQESTTKTDNVQETNK